MQQVPKHRCERLCYNHVLGNLDKLGYWESDPLTIEPKQGYYTDIVITYKQK
jgi:hypothetical protein